jgi:hypothetical protein
MNKSNQNKTETAIMKTTAKKYDQWSKFLTVAQNPLIRNKIDPPRLKESKMVADTKEDDNTSENSSSRPTSTINTMVPDNDSMPSTTLINREIDEEKTKNEEALVIVSTPKNIDIISGRGAGIDKHEGNIRFRAIMKKYQDEYAEALSTEDKRITVNKLLFEVQATGSRFLKHNPKVYAWVYMTKQEIQKKTTQALRDMKNNQKKDVKTDQEAKFTDEPVASVLKSSKRVYDEFDCPNEENCQFYLNEDFCIDEHKIKVAHTKLDEVCSLIILLKKKLIELEKEQQKLMYHFFVESSPSLPKYSPDKIKSKVDQFDKICVEINNLKIKHEQWEKQKIKMMQNFFMETGSSLPIQSSYIIESKQKLPSDHQANYNVTRRKKRKVLQNDTRQLIN